MNIKENPASRLHDILSEAHYISKKNPTGSKFQATWARVFEVGEKDLDKILQGIISVQNLYNQTKDIIENHEFLNNEKNNKYLDKIYKAIYIINLQGNMSSYNVNMTSDTLLALSYIAEHIEILLKHQKTLLSKEEKEDLIKNIDKLIEDFIESNLPDDLKSTCISSLSYIKESLIHYKIYGAKGLQESIVIATGNLILNPTTSEYKNHKSIGVYFNIIQRINAIFTTTESGLKIAATINKFIT